MTEESWTEREEHEATDRVRAVLCLPVPVNRSDCGNAEYFDPWEILPSLYGTYSSEFDAMAIQVLKELADLDWTKDRRRDLAAEMFREMLCSASLCDYGSSPRTCFPTPNFAPILPELIQKWESWSAIWWEGEDN